MQTLEQQHRQVGMCCALWQLVIHDRVGAGFQAERHVTHRPVWASVTARAGVATRVRLCTLGNNVCTLSHVAVLPAYAALVKRCH